MSSWSPYNYTFNNPIGYTDPDGRFPQPVIAFLVGGFLEATSHVAEARFIEGKTWNKSFSAIDYTNVLVSASVSGVTGVFDGGAATIAKHFSKRRNRVLFRKTLEAAGEVIINTVENILKDYYADDYGKNGIDLTGAIYGGLKETAFSSYLPSGNFFEKQAKKHSNSVEKLNDKINRKSFSKKSDKKQNRIRNNLAKAKKEAALNGTIANILGAANTVNAKVQGNQDDVIENTLPSIIVKSGQNP